MISNITYRFSLFADYSGLVYNKNDVIAIMNTFDKMNLVPMQVAEMNAVGIPTQRMHFSGMNKCLTIAISSQRIDITRISDCDNLNTIFALKIPDQYLCNLKFEDEEGETPTIGINGKQKQSCRLLFICKK